jgi:hypothetical protein
MQRRQEQKWLVRLAVVLALVGVLAGWSWVATYGATSLRIIAWRIVIVGMTSGPISPRTYPPHFDRTITDEALVQQMQNQMDSLRRGIWGGGGCNIGAVSYRYALIFSTLGLTTQIYTGTSLCVIWQVETPGWIPSVTPFPYAMVDSPFTALPTLQQKLGVPGGT